jgi:dihydroneopterin aldolase
MITVHLHNVILFAHHGIYDEEKINGNTFEINLDVVYDDDEENVFENIEHTISYEDLFVIVKNEMQTPTPLLEKVCVQIINKIKKNHPSVKEAVITMYKLQAPIEGFKGKAGVTISKKFED